MQLLLIQRIMHIWQALHLPSQAIGIFPEGFFLHRTNFSIKKSLSLGETFFTGQPKGCPVILFKSYYAFPTEPNNSIFSFTVALIASAPGANNLRGSNPLPC